MRACPAALAALTAAACSGRAAPQHLAVRRDATARAFRVEHSGQLLVGPAASGRVGDIRLDNGVIAVIVSAPENVAGFSLSGGNVIDAARVTPPAAGVDELREVFLYLDDTFPRQGIYESIAIEVGDGATAVVVARGADSSDPRLAIRQEYRLDAGADYLTIRTELYNRGAEPLREFELGDVIQWGRCERFAPGVGDTRGRLEVEWLAGFGDEVSYGFTTASGLLRGPSGTSWSDPIAATATIEPGESATFERYLVVGPGTGPAGVAARVMALRGEPAAAVRGRVVDERGRGLAGAWVELADAERRPVMRARSRDDGGFELPVAAGAYEIVASALGRGATASHPATAGSSTAPVELALPASSSLTVSVTAAAAPLAARLTVLGAGQTPTPSFGPRHRAAGADNIVLTAGGQAVIPLDPGDYRVVASHGLEYTIAEATVAVAPGARGELRLALEHVVDTPGYLGADLHQHALPSGDSALTLSDRVLSNLAEGVELLVGSDHNQITDYGPTIEALGARARLASLSGVEVTSESQGHFNAYPVPVRPDRPRGGAPAVRDQTARELLALVRSRFPRAVLQLNHPRTQRIGYFAVAGFDRDAVAGELPVELSFDAIEIVNGRRLEDTEAVLADWLWMLRRGIVATAVGSADSHSISEAPVGFPRTYLGLGTDDPAALDAEALIAALRVRRDALVTNGPYISLRSADGRSAIGRTLTGPTGGTVAVELEVRAAPWVDVRSVEIEGARGPLRPAVAVTTPRDRVVRYRETLALPVGTRAFYVVIARGEDPLDPVVPGATPIAIANPVWVAPAP